jgi:AcrR family transcriptional regulator
MNPKEERENAVRKTKMNLILDASIEVFARLGYHAARLEDIADAAGFSKTALYYYFKDKEEIFLNLCLREHEKLLEEVRKNTADCRSFLSFLKVMIRTILSVFGEHFPLLLNMSNSRTIKTFVETDFLKYREEIDKFREFRNEIENYMIERIDTGKASGEISSVLESGEIADHLEALVKGVFQRWYLKGSMGDIEKEIGSITSFICSGLGIKENELSEKCGG